MAIEKIDEFLSQSVTSDTYDPRAEIGDRVARSGEASSIFQEQRDKYKQVDSDQIDIPAQKAGIIANDGILAELAKSSRNEEGDVAGRTENFEDLYKKIVDMRGMLNFKDNEKLALTGSMPTTNKTSDGRLDKEEAQVYGICEECGKKLEKPSKNGFCSKKCEISHNLKMYKQLNRDLRISKEKTKEKVKSAIELCNNFLGDLGDMQGELASIPDSGFDERYKVYFKVGLTSIIQYLKRSINEELIQKNDYIMMKLEKKKAFIKELDDLGEDSLQKAFDKIEKAISAAQALNDKMNQLYDKARKIICDIDPTRIEPDSLSFGMTIRSNTYYPMKFAKKLENNNTKDSAGSVIMGNEIMEYVNNMFPQLNENTYAESSGVFNAAFKSSSYNAPAQQYIIEKMCDTWKCGAEPLPKYEKLQIPLGRICNIHWMAYLLSSFGPHGQKHYALPFMP